MPKKSRPSGGLADRQERAAEKPLGDNASAVEAEGLVIFELPESTGRNDFLPAPGFRWAVREGRPCLEADYKVSAYKGGGSIGVQSLEIRVNIK